ncbi:prepilin-type N-terminal cleavage/methylation domain-containing protein [Pelagicoccus sp. SDUM812002]|uniref:type IV pilus modification PilV family protein n=1 Tax=Pelagicoccus sp. SDUM812002 TaxID=3041266 RepID=UPI00280C450C|nr:prepilin-type N-terminal cleavage/methylation domain-containing protein [Pelagicoccus sp. SDUM812002]MDQ8186901.1 prepilin-type N-terminal cleavage/methylation domain-containing protein [Pelagicoccus sp. SDUM812002]
MPSFRRRSKTKPATAAFTLVEVMVGTVIFTIASVGVLSGLLQARKMTEGSIYVATATTVAQGYVEQLKNMKFRHLDESTIPELISQGVPDSLIVSPLPADVETGNADTDIVNTRSIDINNTPEVAQDDLSINFVVYVQDITDEANGVGEARRIVLRWDYTDNSTGANVAVGNTLYAIRSRIPTF